MKTRIHATLAALALALPLALPASAQDAGDPAKGEKEFSKCKSCHTLVAPGGDVALSVGDYPILGTVTISS